MQAQVARIIGQGDDVTAGQIPFTPRAKKVLELSLREALNRSDNYIGTEHILLGLLREGEGVAARILMDYAPLEEIRLAAVDVDAAKRAGEEREFKPESPPLAAEVIEELKRVRAATERGVDEEPVDLLKTRPSGRPTRGQQRATSYGLGNMVSPMLTGWMLFALALGVGLLIGWAIWGR